jgi:hypothetical protein
MVNLYFGTPEGALCTEKKPKMAVRLRGAGAKERQRKKCGVMKDE